jgi:hypothetical protein
MSSLLQANFDDLHTACFTKTEAPHALARTLEYRDSDPQALQTLLRHHATEAITDLNEIELRSAFDDLLSYCSALELALIGGYIGPPNTWPNRRSLLSALSRPEVKWYFVEHYPLKLPQLLLGQLEERLPLPTPLDSSAGLCLEFFAIDHLFREHHADGTLLYLLDDFTIDGVRFNDVLGALKRPEVFLKSVLRPADERGALDWALVELGQFIEFSRELLSLLDRANTDGLLQSAFWHFYCYWFDIIGDELVGKMREALLQFEIWKPEDGNAAELLEFRTELASAREIFGRLTDRSFAIAIDQMVGPQVKSSLVKPKKSQTRDHTPPRKKKRERRRM